MSAQLNGKIIMILATAAPCGSRADQRDRAAP
jgi:hypothetical protein